MVISLQKATLIVVWFHTLYQAPVIVVWLSALQEASPVVLIGVKIVIAS